MRLLGNNAIVEFITDHNKILCSGRDGDIVRAENWVSSDDRQIRDNVEVLVKIADQSIQNYERSYNASPAVRRDLEMIMRQAVDQANEAMAELENMATRVDENQNYLQTNPQIAVIKHPNIRMDYKPGDWVFVHYMAYEWAEMTEFGTMIDADFIFFQICDDSSLKLVDDLYLGEAVYSEEQKTASGIIYSLGGEKDNLKVRLTHLPPNNEHFKVGDVVLSIDKHNYEFSYGGQKYIKLMKSEIVGKITNDGLKPVA